LVKICADLADLKVDVHERSLGEYCLEERHHRYLKKGNAIAEGKEQDELGQLGMLLLEVEPGFELGLF
jgi:hypothetical protein